MRYVVLCISLFMNPASALAQDCDNASDQRTLDACAATAFEKSDAELNSVYKQIEQRLTDDADKLKLLVTAQRNWIAFRDAECAFSASNVAGASAYPMVNASCQDGLTQKRTDELKLFLNCEEGDLSCPVPVAD